MPTIIFLVVLAAIILFAVLSYNNLVKQRNRVNEAWSDIDVQLKRRYNLIPNLVETVKGYASHEQETLTKVTEARNMAVDAKDIKSQGMAENMLSGALKSLFAVSESYPDLKANQNFIQLQQELVDTEDKIQASRRFYNGVVRDFNTKVQAVPVNIIAGMFGFKAREFFEIEDEAQKENVDVSFKKEVSASNVTPVQATPAATPEATQAAPQVQPAEEKKEDTPQAPAAETAQSASTEAPEDEKMTKPEAETQATPSQEASDSETSAEAPAEKKETEAQDAPKPMDTPAPASEATEEKSSEKTLEVKPMEEQTATAPSDESMEKKEESKPAESESSDAK